MCPPRQTVPQVTQRAVGMNVRVWIMVSDGGRGRGKRKKKKLFNVSREKGKKGKREK